MISCQKFQEKLALLFDEARMAEITPEEQAHLEACPDCRAYYQTLSELDGAIAKLPQEKLPPSMVHESMEDIMTALSNPKALSRQQDGSLWKWLSAAAAVILVTIGLLYFPAGPSQSNGTATGAPEFYLHSAEIGQRAASTMVYDSGNAQKPLIVWLY